ncbi:MAG: geranylgeranylglyceryl/heptaprenylglyceryl phosphate synthase [Thermoplasmata archaeon]
MKVLDYLTLRLKEGKLHMTLLDPDKAGEQGLGELAATATDLGTDAIMIGGSTGVSQEDLDRQVEEVKTSTTLPVILFPANAGAISPHADAIYFMSLLNSRRVQHVVREQQQAAQAIHDMGLETLAMGYVVVEPGMKVGEVGHADLVRRDAPEEAVKYALTAEFFGMDFFYLEAGSGAPAPVPAEMIRAVKRESHLPLLVGGGIRGSDAAREVAKAGADVIVTGTVVERPNGKAFLKDIIEAVKGP